MALGHIKQDSQILAYLELVSEPEHPALRALREATSTLDEADMQSAPAQMGLIALLLKMSGARDILEIGCFTGYGSLAMALAAPDGQVTTLDINEHWVGIGRKFWQQAGVERQISFKQGLAINSLITLHEEGLSFDFIYVDADKKSYPDYLDASLRLLRPGGLIALDNMLWGGHVADPGNQSRQAIALRKTAESIAKHERLTSALLPICDGLMLARLEA